MTDIGWLAVIGVSQVRHWHGRMALTSPAQQREMLALSFEQTKQGFVYYHYRWSRGMPVTPEEREEYLNIPVFGSRRAWRKSLAGRETTPPRAYRPVARKLLQTMPFRMAIFGLIFGVVGLVSGFNESNMALATVYVAANYGRGEERWDMHNLTLPRGADLPGTRVRRSAPNDR